MFVLSQPRIFRARAATLLRESLLLNCGGFYCILR